MQSLAQHTCQSPHPYAWPWKICVSEFYWINHHLQYSSEDGIKGVYIWWTCRPLYRVTSSHLDGEIVFSPASHCSVMKRRHASCGNHCGDLLLACQVWVLINHNKMKSVQTSPVFSAFWAIWTKNTVTSGFFIVSQQKRGTAQGCRS